MSEEDKEWLSKYNFETGKLKEDLSEQAYQWAKNNPERADELIREYFVEKRKGLLIRVRAIFRKYVDTTQFNIEILSLWALGTYFHSQFETFPLLQLYAQKRSGKTRTLKLLSSLCKGSDGSVSTSPTETLLFRHKSGALFFDEMENISSKERGAFRETLNAVYKRGNKIIRYQEAKSKDGQDYVEKCFYPYYPIGLANISGLNDVLSDRAIQVILQRSNKKLTLLIEDFGTNEEIKWLKEELTKMDIKLPERLFSQWNDFVNGLSLQDSFLKEPFEKIAKTNIHGRVFEILLPLFVVSYLCGDLDNFLKISEAYVLQREEEELVDDTDEMLRVFIIEGFCKYIGFVSLSAILEDFRAKLDFPEEWINSKWLGRALKRLGFISKKRLVNGKTQVILNINSTNTTDTTNSTNSTNSTEKGVELIDKMDIVEEKICSICGSLNANFTQDGQIFYCETCGRKKFG